MLTVAAPCGCRVSFNENSANLRRSISEYIRIFPFTFLEKLDTHTTLCREQIGARHKFQVLSDYGRSRACSTIERRLRNRPKQKKVGDRKRIEEKIKGKKEERKKEKRVANDASSIIIITICDGFSRIRRRAKALSSNK